MNELFCWFLAMSGISGVTRYYDYSVFFHYKEVHSIPCIWQWVIDNSLEAVGCREMDDAVNKTDRHLQVWMRRSEEWTTSMSNAWGTTAKFGKLYLVPSKVANAGAKGAKRWSKVASFVRKVEAIQYVLKDGGEPLTHNVELTEEMRLPPTRVLELRDQRRLRQAKLGGKQKAFYQNLLDLWEECDRPRNHRDIYEMIVDHVVLNKWNYCDSRSIYRMATWLSLRTGSRETKARLMAEYEENKS